jgi:transposase
VLFPEGLDEYIGEDNPVRAVDVFVDTLNLEQQGFARTLAREIGRPGYHSATLLKIYLYGYLNRIQSSRRLERERAGTVFVAECELGKRMAEHLIAHLNTKRP